jgi:uncharacterized protein
MKLFNTIVMLIVVIGGINWGLVGLLDFNLVDFLFGKVGVDKVIYVIVGVAALYLLFAWKAITGHSRERK